MGAGGATEGALKAKFGAAGAGGGEGVDWKFVGKACEGGGPGGGLKMASSCCGWGLGADCQGFCMFCSLSRSCCHGFEDVCEIKLLLLLF